MQLVCVSLIRWPLNQEFGMLSVAYCALIQTLFCWYFRIETLVLQSKVQFSQ